MCAVVAAVAVGGVAVVVPASWTTTARAVNAATATMCTAVVASTVYAVTAVVTVITAGIVPAITHIADATAACIIVAAATPPTALAGRACHASGGGCLERCLSGAVDTGCPLRVSLR
jgi:hypothetical protein